MIRDQLVVVSIIFCNYLKTVGESVFQQSKHKYNENISGCQYLRLQRCNREEAGQPRL